MKESREILLSETCSQAKLPKHMLQGVLLGGEDALFHHLHYTQIDLASQLRISCKHAYDDLN